MTAANLLVELFVEELPPKALRRLGEAFAALLADGLRAQRLLADGAQVTDYATPRRLAVHITQVLARAEDVPQRVKLMPARVGLVDGRPSAALLKKLRALGQPEDAAARVQCEGEGDAAMLYLDTVQPGAALADGLQKALAQAIAQLPIPKVMTYQLAQGTPLPGWDSVQFVRPAHGLVALHGAEVVPVTALGLQAGRATHGHRFEAACDPIEITSADSYAAQMREQGAVIASFEERRADIARQIAAATAAAGAGLRAIEDEALLDEVTALVERPNVLCCQFDEAFLRVPQECLILTMKANQKYFPLLTAEGRLSNRFLVVSNITPADPAAIIDGNERVVRPRLADAQFFYEQDCKKTLESRVDLLARVVYHNKLGTQAERSARVAHIARAIVEQLRQARYPYSAADKDEFDALDSKVQQAARLAKCDLLSDMVGEFPEMQGIMGGYLARHEGLRDGVAIAIEDHYKPRFAGDALPRNHTGAVLALADKLETLVGLFGIGELPSGERDPYALRRHALGVLRILGERKMPLALPALIAAAVPAFGGLIENPQDKLMGFVADRLAISLRDGGASAREVEAVLALPIGRLDELHARLAAVRAFAALPEAPALAAANKRIGRILKKSEGAAPAENVDAALLQEPAEKALFEALQSVAAEAGKRHDAGDYAGELQTLAALRAPVDAFFDEVLVNAEDAALRANRLALLAALHRAMNRVAELSRLDG
ncbi:MAG: glycine--tRNA ligase subunit beta [Ottowia sp.]|nr:glycine--tRNA ligase subunit beta [Ottowia sp.]